MKRLLIFFSLFILNLNASEQRSLEIKESKEEVELNKNFFNAVKNGNVDLVTSYIKYNKELINKGNNQELGQTAIMIAIKYGHVKIVELLLTNNADVSNIKDATEKTALDIANNCQHSDIKKLLSDFIFHTNPTPYNNFSQKTNSTQFELNSSKNNKANELLIHSARDGKFDKVKEALGDGAFINAVDNTGMTALMWAAGKNHTDIVEFLITLNADVDAKDKEGITALDWALNRSAPISEIVNLLIKCQYGSKKDIDLAKQSIINNKLINYAKTNSYGKLKNLLDLNPPVSGKSDINFKDENGFTALMYAAQKGYVEIVQLLIENGAIHIPQYGEPALRLASYNGKIDIVKLLLKKEYKIDINTPNEICTPLIHASGNGQIDIVRFLILHGADINKYGIYDITSTTALIVASENDHVDIANLLINHYANINSTNNSGDNALTVAAREYNTDIIKLLIREGSNYTDNDIALTQHHEDDDSKNVLIQELFYRMEYEADKQNNFKKYKQMSINEHSKLINEELKKNLNENISSIVNDYLSIDVDNWIKTVYPEKSTGFFTWFKDKIARK